MQKTEIEHPLNSLNAIEQIKKNLLDASHNMSLDAVSRLGIKDSMPRPKDGTWFPLQREFRAKKIEEYKNSTIYASMIGHITRGEYGRYPYRDQKNAKRLGQLRTQQSTGQN
jgi:hypothetical protein